MRIPLIEFKDVTKRFGDKVVLNGVNLEIYENEITTIIGKSGTGKSVLLKHIIGLLKPDEGSVCYNGKSIDSMNRHERETYRGVFSYLFQNNALFDSKTVFENVAFPLEQTTNLGKRDIEARVRKRIEDLELVEAVNKYPSELSGGMQKRVALARALVTDPKIVLFDEPTTGQDPIRKNMILSMIVHYRRKFGFTAVMISHDIPDVFFISDRIVILWEGGVGFEGPYQDAVKRKLPIIDEFLRSLEGFQDELTGLLSREAFRVHYSAILSGSATMANVSAVLFSIELDHPYENPGAQATVEVLRAIGEFATQRFSPLGGISTRHSRDQILIIFPHTNADEARELVSGFAKDLQEKALARIEKTVRMHSGEAMCLDICVRAGATDIAADDDIEKIIEKARGAQIIVATYRCESGGNG